MRRLFLLLGMICATCILNAQENVDKEHMLFVGVPIDGSVESFCHNLTKYEGFVRRSEKDENGKMAFSGDVFGEGFWVWAYFDTKREINDNLVYQVVIARWFDSKELLTSYLNKFVSGMKSIYGSQITNIKQTELNLEIDLNNGSVEATLKDKGEGKWSMVARFLDYRNDDRVFKTFDYTGVPAKGPNGIYDINPSKLKVHGH